MIGIIFGVFFLCLVLGIPIAMAMGFGTIFPALLDLGKSLIDLGKVRLQFTP